MPIINNFCITHKYFNFLESLDCKIIIGGSESRVLSKTPSKWIRDNIGENISKRNKHFGTLTSHYWVWKNQLDKFNDKDWIGFSHYRRHWIKTNNQKFINLQNLNKNLLKNLPEKVNFDVLLPKKIELKNLKLSKLVKRGLINCIKNPSILINRKKYSINLHFNLFHANEVLKKSADLLEKEDKDDFKYYIENQNSFHQFEMFISQKKNIKLLYKKTFKWIFKCEKEFSNIRLEGYGKERLYNFLAERFFSFYFEKYTKIKIWPYVFLNSEILR